METYTLTQREFQLIAVISDCVQGRGKVDRAAQLLALSPRHIKRLKARYRQGGEAAMAPASRGGAGPRPPPGAGPRQPRAAPPAPAARAGPTADPDLGPRPLRGIQRPAHERAPP